MAKRTEGSGLSFELSDEQLKALKPLLDQAGKLQLIGSISDRKFNVSYLACQMAFTPDIRLGSK